MLLLRIPPLLPVADIVVPMTEPPELIKPVKPVKPIKSIMGKPAMAAMSQALSEPLAKALPESALKGIATEAKALAPEAPGRSSKGASHGPMEGLHDDPALIPRSKDQRLGLRGRMEAQN
ncbi:MAG: hypothetical protein HYY20_11610 [Candidatus Tectomicrobia bacterium]|uniref:Uncharacterized protein n=1 Tax=Tectimicrobiota bacterium TaxID=2528274 RepID=A0A932CQN0_UNCTE|nr:hypothetical protein [Candidatus Tectomicrobia bacterium]